VRGYPLRRRPAPGAVGILGQIFQTRNCSNILATNGLLPSSGTGRVVARYWRQFLMRDISNSSVSGQFSAAAGQGAIPAVPKLSDAREAARRCVNSVVELVKAGRAADRDVSLDPNPYVARVFAAVENGWQPICRFWPELVAAGEALVFDETLSLPDTQFPAPVEAWLLAQRTLEYVACERMRRERFTAAEAAASGLLVVLSSTASFCYWRIWGFES
jgi:hypothetical protein